MKKFKSTERQGFHMTFENGLTISVQWGFINYCDNKVFTINDIKEDHFYCRKDMESDTAEIAIMLDGIILEPFTILKMDDPSDKDYNAPFVMGYLTPENVLDIMNKVKSIDKGEVEKIRTTINGPLTVFKNKLQKMLS